MITVNIHRTQCCIETVNIPINNPQLRRIKGKRSSIIVMNVVYNLFLALHLNLIKSLSHTLFICFFLLIFV